MNYYKSNGKFLLTGEYLVLKGAMALALPLKLGQSMNVETLDRDEDKIYWDAYKKSTDIIHGNQHIETSDHFDKFSEPWFSVVLDKNYFSVIKTDDEEKAERLSNILSKVKLLNNDIFNDSHDYRFCTLLDFDPQWGLGSSSTLINNISEWANIDPYLLLDSTFKGSGYDIACAKAESPIFYSRQLSVVGCQSSDNRRVCSADFNPDFKDNLYFVYQGHKQNSANEVKAFLAKDRNYESEIQSISEISKIMPDIKTLRDFCYFIKIHEEIMEKCLDQKRIKKYYSDFDGEMKSLGAWGGDFFLAATEWEDEKVRKYFEKKGFNVIISYDNIILN